MSLGIETRAASLVERIATLNHDTAAIKSGVDALLEHGAAQKLDSLRETALAAKTARTDAMSIRDLLRGRGESLATWTNDAANTLTWTYNDLFHAVANVGIHPDEAFGSIQSARRNVELAREAALKLSHVAPLL